MNIPQKRNSSIVPLTAQSFDVSEFFTQDVADVGIWLRSQLRTDTSAEKLLMIAVLEQSIKDLKLARNNVFFRSAKSWFLFPKLYKEWAFSFENICTALGFPAQRIKEKLGETYGAW